MRALVALALLALAGCSTYELGPEWSPLTTIIERPATPFTNATTTTTIGAHVYTEDLDQWLEDYPPGSVRFHAIMLHEREHARRQFRYKGLPGELAKTSWIMRYLTDHRFMLQEEQAGYYLAITHLFQNALWSPHDTIRTATNMSSYRTFPGGRQMISFTEARRWIEDVLFGHWKPPSK